MAEQPETSPEAGFSRALALGILFRAALTSLAMLCAFGGAAIAANLDGEWWEFGGACAGLAVGILVGRWIKPRWDPLAQSPVATGREPSATHSLHEPG